MVRDPSKVSIPLINRALNRVYLHIGSEAKLLRIVEEFYEVMSKDVLLFHFFEGKDLKLIAQKQTEFLLKAMGVKASYEGKAPADAHTAIASILEGHFNRRLVLLEQVLKQNGLPKDLIDLWISFENSFREGVLS